VLTITDSRLPAGVSRTGPISFSISFSAGYRSKYLYKYQQDTRNQGKIHITQHFSCQELSVQRIPKILFTQSPFFSIQYIDLFV
jgi:hypothetical protein